MASDSKSSKSNPALASAFRSLGRSLIFRGVLEIAFGALLLIVPVPTIKILTIVIGVSLILGGLLQLLSSMRSATTNKHWAVINAAVLLVFGVLIIFFPKRVENIWIIALGVWLIVSAFSELFSGGWRRLWGLLSCILSLVVGAVFIAFPLIGMALVVAVTAGVMITSGVLTICAGVDLHIASKKV